MEQVAAQAVSAWTDAATEDIQLRSMFTTGAPYVTIYIDGPIRCSDHRILHGLYYAGGEARTAQTFVCSFCGESIDVVNVHAPSGTRQLMDSQRQTLLTNLLQSNSRTRPGRTIGNAHFVIGGDMNTAPFRMSQLLQTCRNNGSLRTEARTHEQNFAKHGDLCVSAGVQARTLTTTAPNHDPQHYPYGICWSMPQRSATEQPSSITPATKQSAAPSSGYATEQSLLALSAQASLPRHQTASSSSSVWKEPRAPPAGGSATEQPLPAPPTPPLTLGPAMPARLELENLAKRAEESELSDSDIERAPQEEAAAAAAAAATEHSEETTNLPAEKQLIYSIVNAFLNNITFHHPQAEELLVAALNDETCLTPSIHLHVEQVFPPIFFHYPKWLGRPLGVGAARY